MFAISGAHRQQELVDMNVRDVSPEGNLTVINIPDTKNKKPNNFTIEGQFHEIFLKYFNLRSPETPHSRLFVNYQQGKCTKQVIGTTSYEKYQKTLHLG